MDDRGNKFENYQGIPSLREYVLVLQDRVRVEHYARREDGDEWVLKVVAEAEAPLRFPALGCEAAVSDIYAKVAFPMSDLALHDDPSLHT